jgi:hypothetical protein
VQECLDQETGRRIYYFLSGYGLRFNEGFARMVAYLLARQRMSDICMTTYDSGFVLSLPASGKVNLPAIIGCLHCFPLLNYAMKTYKLIRGTLPERDEIEKSFKALKSEIDILPLNTHSEKTNRGFIFIAFLSLIIRTRLMKNCSCGRTDNSHRNDKKTERYS